MSSTVRGREILEDVCSKLGIEADHRNLAKFVMSEIVLRLAPRKRLVAYERGILP